MATLPKLARAAMVKPIRLPELDVTPPEEQAPPPPPPPIAEPAPAPGGTTVSSLAAGVGSMSLGGGGDALMPGPPPPPPSFDEATDAGLEELVGMGFGREAAREALAQARGSVQEASESLMHAI
jgi:hypothetical protein